MNRANKPKGIESTNLNYGEIVQTFLQNQEVDNILTYLEADVNNLPQIENPPNFPTNKTLDNNVRAGASTEMHLFQYMVKVAIRLFFKNTLIKSSEYDETYKLSNNEQRILDPRNPIFKHVQPIFKATGEILEIRMKNMEDLSPLIKLMQCDSSQKNKMTEDFEQVAKKAGLNEYIEKYFKAVNDIATTIRKDRESFRTKYHNSNTDFGNLDRDLANIIELLNSLTESSKENQTVFIPIIMSIVVSPLGKDLNLQPLDMSNKFSESDTAATYVNNMLENINGHYKDAVQDYNKIKDQGSVQFLKVKELSSVLETELNANNHDATVSVSDPHGYIYMVKVGDATYTIDDYENNKDMFTLKRKDASKRMIRSKVATDMEAPTLISRFRELMLE